MTLLVSSIVTFGDDQVVEHTYIRYLLHKWSNQFMT